MAKTGRPKKEFNKETFEGLCEIMCTESEICNVLRTTDKTLSAWCKRTYGQSFSEIYKKLADVGRKSLRRYQFDLAKKSPAMAIFLGKQYLGQRDVVEYNQGITDERREEVNKLLESVKQSAGD